MQKSLIHIIIFLCLAQILHAQEDDGVVALSLPIRNSLKFNRYAINPTFSFVRESNKYLTFTNKREWVQFENAPQTYLFSYSGRFAENTGVGIGFFQQNYGVLTTFGGVINYAYNVVLNRDSNLTLGLNVGVYKSGIDEGSVVTNFPDPSLQNIPSNLIATINPGINYGTTFLDFGVSLNNIVAYNIKTSQIIEENPEQSIQAHAMYTGFVDSRGFFDGSKFSGLVRSEFKKDETVLSGIMMLTTSKGIWGQAGYNTLYGVSAGIGLNITNEIAIEYNYEKEIGDMSTFGNSHEFTLAYKFKKKERYIYSDDNDDEGALISPSKKSKNTSAKRNTPEVKVDREAIAKEKAEAKAEALAKLEEKKEQRVKTVEENKDTQAKADEEAAKIKLAQEEAAQAKAEEEAKTKLAQEAAAQAKADEEAKAKLAQEAAAQAKADEEAKAKLAQEVASQAKADEEAKIKLAQEAAAQAKADKEARIKLLQEEARAKADAEYARIKLAQAKEKAEKEALAKQQKLDAASANVPKDDASIAISNLTKSATDAKLKQEELITKLNETVASREKELQELKRENDLSEQGIYTAPKPFKSISGENAALESLKNQIDDVIIAQDEKIKELENLYNERLENVSNGQGSENVVYLNEINALKEAQSETKTVKADLESQLETIQEATEYERKRRIKRAAYDNEEDRYNKDKAALNIIKQTTPPATVPLKESDFDFGEDRGDNIEIIKGVRNVESGYYIVIAVHSDMAKRDEFLTKAVAAGQKDINFFYDAASSKYYIYYQKFDSIGEASGAMSSKGSTPYNSKSSMIKIEN
ncbi:type IX secretion system PorP/SprF family membrane protein [Mariniflexile fucanivorans]|uniref:Type IX secretion system PorP/SprF family membrane protein n=1 Tax=Mariniflexile fucanivorans TaxID=264023 RepID=A0A4R1RCI6_9FLAO|nr:PorP/SprF family type IX secretion system membrane protein [Mariniflexile fucanivorans]TCL63182.1 type IX secretion system PorP/SprF family membrane protein [Mariniflexile fucanivorans]